MVRGAPGGWWLLLLVPLLFGTYAEGMFRGLLDDNYPIATDHPEQRWLFQRLDHFNKGCRKFWKQRYFVNDNFYRRGGPVFLELGGEAPADSIWETKGSLIKYAERMGALHVLLEHRYYGKSQPTTDISTENLRFLSSQQALKDVIYFRRFLIRKFKLFRNKWVVFGGSYAGSLAASLRVKHPSMFHSAVAYSAPIYAKANFSEYLEVVQEALFRHGGSECVDAVRNALQVLTSMLANEEYHAKIADDFRLCHLRFDSEAQVTFFLDSMKNKISSLVQYNREKPLNQVQMNYDFNYKMTESDITLNYFCGVMTSESLGTPYERYAYFFVKSLEANNHWCLNLDYENILSIMKYPGWEGRAAQGPRQWTYQCCSEFGFFQNTESEHQPFLGIPMSYYIDQCEKIFGSRFNHDSVLESVENTNKCYYEPLIKTGRRILFVNGELDPWHALSINSRMPRNLIGISIKDSSHCEAAFESTINDSQDLKDARHFVQRTLLHWLPKRG